MFRAVIRFGCWLTCFALLSACGADGGSPTPDPPGDGDTVGPPRDISLPDLPPVHLPEAGSGDTPDAVVAPPDLPPLAPDADARVPDADVVAPDADQVLPDDCPGAAGCPCDGDEDCPGALCVETAAGLECATPCLFQVQCPPGRVCREVTRDDGDPVGVCVDPLARLCQPCVAHDECEPREGGFMAEYVCLPHGPLGSFCTAPCDDARCPDGYACDHLAEHPDAAAQCVPLELGTCPCPDAFVERQAVTVCYVENEYGRCSVERLCDEPCAAATPAPEVCNGHDDNCDGVTDEGTEVECYPFYCDSGAGQCVTRCHDVSDCQPDFNLCVDGECIADGGRPCQFGTDCASGFCVDGVCCESACDGVCESCALAPHFGRCQPIRAGTDPADECPTEPVASCGFTGSCDGARACALFAAGTVCLPAHCATETLQLSGACDGGGVCVERQVDCAPLACDPEIGGCWRSCTVTDECPEGFVCDDGECRRGLGTACALDAECASGFCVDAVCCDELCDGLCEWCGEPAAPGLCQAVGAGFDPRDDCLDEGVSGCGTSGVCGDDGTCALYPAGAPCVPPTCRMQGSAIVSVVGECDGLGTCHETTDFCVPFECDGDTGLCITECGGQSDCQYGYVCVDGDCMRAIGTRCASAAECASGFCVDNHCCAGPCDGVCESCALVGTLGVCTPHPQGQDPDNECRAEPPTTCGTVGVCSGARSCLMYGTGTTCAPSLCIDEFMIEPVGRCDGAGNCNQEPTSCSPFRCDANTNACRVRCETSAECAPGAECLNGVCGRALGTSCTNDGECTSRNCAHGVCCATACFGLCERCDLPGSLGSCAPVPAGQDPGNQCTAEPVATCGLTGSCSGQRSCARYAQGVPCADPECVGDWAYGSFVCDGNGRCLADREDFCPPYRCDEASGACLTACNTPADCVPNHECGPGGQCLAIQGQPCGADSDCLSGFCSHGVCCESRCHGVCERCDLAARLGYCDPLPQGTLATDICPVEPVSTCGRTGRCSGARTCERHPAGTVCRSAECAAGPTAESAHRCDGEGNCESQGGELCAPYACVAADVSCLSSCTLASHCAPGFGCDTATGQCLRATGLTCEEDEECLTESCCDGICRDVASDMFHCGECGLECENPNGGTRCFAGVCHPDCSTGWGDCDDDPTNGCEQLLTTIEHCGDCDDPCELPNAITSCTSGNCLLTGCEPGYGNCDTRQRTGCETWLAEYANICDEAEDLGAHCGNSRCRTTGGGHRRRCTRRSWAVAASGSAIGSRTGAIPAGIAQSEPAPSSSSRLARTTICSPTGRAAATCGTARRTPTWAPPRR
jgi:hypothetical protein